MSSDLRAKCEPGLAGSVSLAAKPRVARQSSAALDARTFEDICRQMHTLAGRTQDFDDLVQAAAEQVVRSLPAFKGQAAQSTWTYRICYHTLLKHRRWYRRWLQRFSLSSDDEPPEAAPSDELRPSEWLERRERTRKLREALAVLSPKRRAVVLLHDIDELAIEEIAAIVGANPRTVRSRLRDGRKMLAQALKRDPYFGDAACQTETT